MAVAPLNKFLTKAVPVAPGEQVVYFTPAGTSSIILYAQVANVGIGTTYPTVTFTHRRESTSTRTAGNIRDTDVVKDIEIPPNDTLIIIDGRLVLERTANVKDSIVVRGVQSGITTVYNALYDNITGMTTITTYSDHNFNVGDEITMGGLEFTCPSTAGITSSIFPAPQASFTVETVGTSTVFTTNTGVVAGLPHTFAPSQHRFIRANPDAIQIVNDANQPGRNGSFLQVIKPTSYNPTTGILSVTTSTSHQLSNGDTVGLTTGAFIFKCSQDNFFKEKAYPRTTDPAHFGSSSDALTVTALTDTTFTVGVGAQIGGGLVGPLQMELICSILENSTV